MQVARQILATVLGVIAGGFVTMLVEMLNVVLYRPPAEIENDLEALRRYSETLPIGAALILLAAWCVGCFVAGFVARVVAAQRAMLPGVIAIAIYFTMTCVMLFLIPHPLWLWIVTPLALLGSGLLALALSAPKSVMLVCDRLIAAPIESVFQVVSEPERFKAAVPDIQTIEFLSAQRQGVGTVFRETRLMHGKTAANDLEITEFVPNRMVRIVASAGGAVWDSVFSVSLEQQRTRLTLAMEARPQTLIARLLVPLMMVMVGPAVESDMDAVGKFVEQQGSAPEPTTT